MAREFLGVLRPAPFPLLSTRISYGGGGARTASTRSHYHYCSDANTSS